MLATVAMSAGLFALPDGLAEANIQIGLVPKSTIAKRGAWTTVSVTLATTDKAFDAKLSVGFDGMTPTLSVLDVSLPPNARQRYDVETRVPFDYYAPLRIVLVHPTKNEILAEWSSDYEVRTLVRSTENKRKELNYLRLDDILETDRTLILVIDGDDADAEAMRGIHAKLQRLVPLPNGMSTAVSMLTETVDPGETSGARHTMISGADAENSDFGRGSRPNTLLRYVNRGNARLRDLSEWRQHLTGDALEDVERRISKLGPAVMAASQLLTAMENSNGIGRLQPGGLTNPRFDHEALAYSPRNPWHPYARVERFISSPYYLDPQHSGYYQPSDLYSMLFASLADAPVFIHAAMDLLPKSALGYDGYHAIVWGDADPTKLRDDQRNALLRWIDSGGQLVLSGAERARWMGTWLEDISPARLGPTEEPLFVPRATVPSEHPFSIASGTIMPLRTLLPRNDANVTMMELAGRSIMFRGRHGAGVVTSLGFDLILMAETLRRPPLSSSLVQALFPDNGRSLLFSTTQWNMERMRMAGGGSMASAILTTEAMFGIGALYFVFVIGGSALLASRRRNPLSFWTGLMIATVAASAIAALVVWRLASGPLELRHIALLNADEGGSWARGVSVGGVRSPQTIVAAARFEGPVADVRFATNTGQYRIKDGMEKLGAEHSNSARFLPRIVDGVKGEPADRWALKQRVGLNQTLEVSANYFADLGGAVTAEWSKDRTGGLLVTLKNGTQYTLRRGAFHTDPNMIELVEDLAPGASVIISVPSASTEPTKFSAIEEEFAANPDDFYLPKPELMDVKGWAKAEELSRWATHPSVDRLASWLPQDGQAATFVTDRTRPPAQWRTTLLRSLLGIENENQNFLQESAEIQDLDNQSRYSIAGTRPDRSCQFVAELDPAPVRLTAGLTGAIEKTLEVLCVRIPLPPNIPSIGPSPRPTLLTTFAEDDAQALLERNGVPGMGTNPTVRRRSFRP